MLDGMGLLATLEWLRQECMKLYPERHIELEAGIAEEEVPESLKVNIFRIAQEALNNIAKHSKAEWVELPRFCRQEVKRFRELASLSTNVLCLFRPLGG
jgi:signal transduction histidine kinase